MNPKKEKLIIDMRQATAHDLVVLSRLLLTVNAAVSSHGIRLQLVKKIKVPATPALSAS